jgi:hypothetical protein
VSAATPALGGAWAWGDATTSNATIEHSASRVVITWESQGQRRLVGNVANRGMELTHEIEQTVGQSKQWKEVGKALA